MSIFRCDLPELERALSRQSRSKLYFFGLVIFLTKNHFKIILKLIYFYRKLLNSIHGCSYAAC